jgi:hypothetical protein
VRTVLSRIVVSVSARQDDSGSRGGRAFACEVRECLRSVRSADGEVHPQALETWAIENEVSHG